MAKPSYDEMRRKFLTKEEIVEFTYVNGFDDDNIDNIKQRGRIQYCMQASSGIVYNIDHLRQGTILTGQTTFGDGSALADRTFKIMPEIGETTFTFYRQRNKYTKTATDTIQLATDDSQNLILYDENANLYSPTSYNQFDAIKVDTIVSYVKFNPNSLNLLCFACERHGVIMDPATHYLLHTKGAGGAVWSKGADLEGIVNNGTTFGLITAGVIQDEDIEINIPEVTTIPFLYRDAVTGDWEITPADNLLGYKVNGDVVYNPFDGTLGALTPIGGDCVAMHIFASNCRFSPYVKIIGQSLNATRGTARDRIYSDVIELSLDGLPSPEMVHLYSYIIHREAKGQIELGDDKAVFYDYRERSGSPRIP